MESLLTTAEAHAFKAFLSQINYDSSLADSLVAATEWGALGDDIPVPYETPGKEHLTKATMDLLSLPQPPQPRSSDMLEDLVPPVTPRQPLRLTTTTIPVPAHAPQLISSFHSWHSALRGRSRAPAATAPRADSTSSQSLLGDVSPRSPSSPAIPPPSASTTTSTSQKRLLDDDTSAPSPGPAKRSRASTSASATSSTTPPAARSSSASAAGKPTLLTPSQKKANHIQSEQKRRANIRRGYDALCETVPALVEAIRAEDAANAAAAAAATAGGSKDVPGGKKRRARTKAAAAAAADDGDKVDGRAGPRSENVVLGKTVEHIQDLLGTRQALLERLERARSLLPAGHPGLLPEAPGLPLWEREWTGGDDPDADEGAGDSDDDAA